LKHIRDGGSFTLTTGQINEDPISVGASGAMVNGGLEAFARSAAIELPRGLRINVVSPTVTEEAWSAFGPFFPGQKPVPASEPPWGTSRASRECRRARYIESAGLATERFMPIRDDLPERRSNPRCQCLSLEDVGSRGSSGRTQYLRRRFDLRLSQSDETVLSRLPTKKLKL
jgi:NAD(P)-dependent dehydrogenase (short-subunit alcohol dehydrogenase family)